MRYYLENLLEEPIRSYHRNLVDQVAEEFPSLTWTKEQGLDAHFTLKYHFETEDIAGIERLIGEFAATHASAPVHIGGFDHFRGDTVFVRVEASQPARLVLVDLINKLKDVAWMSWDEHDGPSLHFHMTIAQHCRGMHEEVLAFLRDKEQYFETSLSNITILREAGKTSNDITLWEVHKSYPLARS